jgi:hypothetical protein
MRQFVDHGYSRFFLQRTANGAVDVRAL